MNLFETRTRITGSRFITFLFCLVGSPFLLPLLPILILFYPIRSALTKSDHQPYWRVFAISSVAIGVSLGAFFAFGFDRIEDGISYVGYPMIYQQEVYEPIFGFEFFPIWAASVRFFNFSLALCVSLLPLHFATSIHALMRRPNK